MNEYFFNDMIQDYKNLNIRFKTIESYKSQSKSKSLDDLLQEKYNLTENELLQMLKKHYPEKLI